MTQKAENRGGVRTSITKKIGRPTKETEVLYIRVPKGYLQECKQAVKEIIKKATRN